MPIRLPLTPFVSPRGAAGADQIKGAGWRYADAGDIVRVFQTCERGTTNVASDDAVIKNG